MATLCRNLISHVLEIIKCVWNAIRASLERVFLGKILRKSWHKHRLAWSHVAVIQNSREQSSNWCHSDGCWCLYTYRWLTQSDNEHQQALPWPPQLHLEPYYYSSNIHYLLQWRSGQSFFWGIMTPSWHSLYRASPIDNALLMPPHEDNEQHHAAHLRAIQCIRQITVTFVAVVSALLSLLVLKDPEPYHTLILSRQGWVDELIEGHPACICCRLGVSREVFLEMITTLRNFGYNSSKYMPIEEQLTIFLYMSVTGLTICHTGECFQCSNEMISKYFCWMLGIFSSEPFYTMYINLPDNDTPPSPWIYHNPSSHLSSMPLALWMVAILCALLHYIAMHPIETGRVFFPKTAYFLATSILTLTFVILGGKGWQWTLRFWRLG